ncbi:hypothetical protein UPYG_G00190540 [Umbra pygmaea]|uniref:Uncharacterized protein n=1 Tax=Umbra pygmaea TaxID=75934 RepID=A0ABD0XFG6_UMBPY
MCAGYLKARPSYRRQRIKPSGFGTAVPGRSPTRFRASNTFRLTVTSAPTDTTSCPAVTALEAKAARLR